MGRNFRDIFNKFDPGRRARIEATAEAKHRQYCADRQEIIVLDDAALKRLPEALGETDSLFPELPRLLREVAVRDS